MLGSISYRIILIIFQYLLSNDIFNSFFNFNQRFNNLLIQQHHFSKSFELPSSDINHWKQIFLTTGLQIETLIINIDYLSLPLNLCPNLKSIIISSPYFIDFDLLMSILNSDQFKRLISLKIKQKILSEGEYCSYNNNEEYLLQNVFTRESKLEIFQYLPRSSCDRPYFFSKPNHISNLHSLILNLLYFTDIFPAPQYTPNVKYLNLSVKSSLVNDRMQAWSKMYEIQLEKLYLTFDIGGVGVDYSTLRNAIKIFSSSLKCLSLNFVNTYNGIDDFQFNGIKLQGQLLESMIHLTEFHLYTRIDHNRNDINMILSTFQNQFWFDHNWFIGIHGNYLYTLPFQFDEIYDFTHFDDVKSSNNDILINNSRLWYNVSSIHLDRSFLDNFDFLKELKIKIKIPKLKSIITKRRTYSNMIDAILNRFVNEKEKNHMTLDNVTTVHFNNGSWKTEQTWLNHHLLPDLKHLIFDPDRYYSKNGSLITTTTENIQHLNICQESLKDLTDVKYVYFPNMEYLLLDMHDIPSDYENEKDRQLIIELLSKMKTFKNLFIRYKGLVPFLDASKYLTIVEDKFKNLKANEFIKNYDIKQFDNWIKILRKIPIIDFFM